jgi:hypothetical protein
VVVGIIPPAAPFPAIARPLLFLAEVADDHTAAAEEAAPVHRAEVVVAVVAVGAAVGVEGVVNSL